MKWKLFDPAAWAALGSALKQVKEAADANASAVSSLGTDLAELSRLTAEEIAALKTSGAAFHAGTEPPEDTRLLWIDTAGDSTGGLKYHDGTGWKAVPVAWG